MSGRLWLVRVDYAGATYHVRTALPLEPAAGDVIYYGPDESAVLALKVRRRAVFVSGPPLVECDVIGAQVPAEITDELERLRFRRVR